MAKKNNKKNLCDCRCIHETRVADATIHALPEHDNQRIAQLFKAMSDANRLKVLDKNQIV